MIANRRHRYLGLLLITLAAFAPLPAFAAIVYTGAASGANNGLPTNMTAGALVINKPAGTVAGQALIATIAARPHGMTVTVPSNWFAMTVSEQVNGGPSTLPGGMTLLTYYHIVGLGEPASYTWTFANTAGSGANYGGSAVGGILAFSGIDTSTGNPINVWSDNFTNGAPHTTTPITPTMTNTMIVSSISYLSGSSFANPTSNAGCVTNGGGATERLDQRAPVAVNDVGTTIQMSTAPCATATTTGAVTAVIQPVGGAGADDSGVGHLMALKPAAIDPGITMTRSAPLSPGGTAFYTLNVINYGNSPEPGPISVVDTLPAGLTYNAAGSGGTGWVCGAVGQVVTCTRAGALAGGASAAALVLNVNVLAGATGMKTNTATVSGTGGDGNMNNNTDTDDFNISVDLAMTMSSGTLDPGLNGIYTIDVSNIGTLPAPGTALNPIKVTDTLPAGLTYVSGTGTGWACGVVGQTVTCNRTSPLAAGAAAGTLTLTVAVGQTVSSITNTATVSSAATDSDASNNSVTLDYTVSADLSMTMTRGAALVPGTNATYTLNVTNAGPNVSPQPITITDTLPAGLTYVSGVGAGWVCGAVGQVVTCTRSSTLASGASSSLVLTVAVGLGATGATITNSATVDGNATDPDPANNTATDSYTIPLSAYAYYEMDETSWTGAAGEVADSSGNSLNASRVGGATVTTQAAPASGLKGDTCMGATIPLGTGAASPNQMGVNTPIHPNALGLGNAGTVSFWYKNNVAWTSNGNTNDRTLLDATGGSNSTEFWLVLQNNGSLRFTLDNAGGAAQTATGSARNFAANTWHHIAITWDFTAHTMATYVDGVLDGSRNNNAVTSETPNYGTFFVGDSKTTAYTNPNRGNSANGVIDEVRFYATALTAAQIANDMSATHSCLTFDHLRIKHDGEGSTCAAESITVEACADTACSLLATTGGISATLQPFGTAVSIGTSGSVTLSVTPSSAGTNTLDATSISPAPVNAVSCLNTATSSASCSLLVSACPGGANFNCLETSITPYSSGTARLYTKLAGTGFSFDVVALNSSGGIETNYVVSGATAKNVTVELFDDSASPQPACNAYAGPVASQTLSFGSANSGRKTTAGFTVPNAYMKLRCRVTDANMAPAAYGCSTDDFSVRPAAFTVTSSDATNTGTSGLPVIKAGANFNLTSSAVAGYNGTPSLDATKVVGTATAGALSGSFGVANSATGVATGSTFTYSEVGNFGLNANAVYDTSFTGIDPPSDCTADFSNTLVGGKYGCKIGSNAVAQITGSSGFGRFIPDHFDTAVVATATAPMPCPTNPTALICPALYNGFVYSGQPFSVQVTAKNAGGNTTQNYQGTLAKAVTLTAYDALGGATPNPSGSLANGTITAATFSAGVATAFTPAYTLTPVTPPTQPIAPTNIFMRAAESSGDGVTSLRSPSSSSVEGGVKVANGRIKVSNGYGSELLPLTLTATAEYYSASGWVTSTTDSVTSLTLSATYPVGSGTTAVTPVNGTLTTGKLPINLAKPSGGSRGRATISPTEINSIPVPSYLQVIPGTATFGIYNSNSNFIYQRENY